MTAQVLRDYRLPKDAEPELCAPFDKMTVHWDARRAVGYAQPMPDQAALGEFYTQRYRRVMGKNNTFAGYLKSPNYRAQTKSQVDWVKPHVGKAGRWLDVGAGLGLLLWTVSRELPKWDLYAVEPDLAARENIGKLAAQETDFDAFWRGEAFQPEMFDVISLSHVLEHLTDPAEAIRTLGRYLKPGGILMIEVPHDDLAQMTDERRASDLPHTWFFSQPGLVLHIHDAGLRVLRQGVVGVARPGTPTSLPRRVFRRLLRAVFGPLGAMRDPSFYAAAPDRCDIRIVCRK